LNDAGSVGLFYCCDDDFVFDFFDHCLGVEFDVFFSEGGFSVLMLMIIGEAGRYVNEGFREGGEDAGEGFDEGNFEFVRDF